MYQENMNTKKEGQKGAIGRIGDIGFLTSPWMSGLVSSDTATDFLREEEPHLTWRSTLSPPDHCSPRYWPLNQDSVSMNKPSRYADQVPALEGMFL